MDRSLWSNDSLRPAFSPLSKSDDVITPVTFCSITSNERVTVLNCQPLSVVLTCNSELRLGSYFNPTNFLSVSRIFRRGPVLRLARTWPLRCAAIVIATAGSSFRRLNIRVRESPGRISISTQLVSVELVTDRVGMSSAIFAVDGS